MYLHHREGFQVYRGAALLEPAHHLKVVIERQIGVQPANNVEFRGAFAHALLSALINFFEGKVVRAGRTGVTAKRAKLAMRHANICGIDVPVNVEIGDVTVPLLAYIVRKPAYR